MGHWKGGRREGEVRSPSFRGRGKAREIGNPVGKKVKTYRGGGEGGVFYSNFLLLPREKRKRRKKRRRGK